MRHTRARRQRMHLPMLPNRRHDSQNFALAAVLLLCLADPARAQTSADLTLVSEYAVRGIALSSQPTIQLRVDRDTDAGWYGGGFASRVTVNDRAQGQFIVYAGRAQRLSSTMSWDVGVMRSLFLRDAALNFHEFYAGLSLQRASVRVFYSPAYYGQMQSAYLDVSSAYPLADHVSLAAHGGLLHAFGDDAHVYGSVYGGSYERAARNRMDVRLLLAADAGDFSWQAGWQGVWHAYVHGLRRARGVTASVTRHF